MVIDSWPVITENIISGNIAETGNGGGLYCYSPPQEITNNLIENNTAGEDGGAIWWFCHSIDPVTVSGNSIHGNSASWEDGKGGGIYIMTTSPYRLTLIDNTFERNKAGEGGGIYCDYGDPLFFRNFLFRNRAQWRGGGMYIEMCEMEVVNCVIARNDAEEGGGIYCEFYGTLTNCTVADNRADRGAGAYCDLWYVYPAFVNCIFWNNAIPLDNEIYVKYSSEPIIRYSNVRGGWPGNGNIDSDPLFVSNDTRDYHLTYNSPCREAGTNLAPGLPTEDYEGDPRIAGTAVDLGCDEFHEHLYYTGSVIPGSWGKVKVIGTPGTSPVELGLGTGKLNPPQTTPFGDLWLQFPLEARLLMPDISSNGISELPVKIPDHWLAGEEHYLQALIGPLAPGSRLTNLLVIEDDFQIEKPSETQ